MGSNSIGLTHFALIQPVAFGMGVPIYDIKRMGRLWGFVCHARYRFGLTGVFILYLEYSILIDIINR